jgi:1-acyl-sn-glycerol-3-phosphate acyltransferase
MPRSLLDVPRSLAFYFAFYGMTLALVVVGGVAMLAGREALIAVVHFWCRFHHACSRHLLGIRVAIEGQPPRPGVLLAIKHEAMYEAIELPNLVPMPAPFAKVELMRLPMWGRFATIYGLIGVERDGGAKALRQMVTAARQRLAEGRPLAIFPEGTRVPHGSRPPLQAGFAGIYKLLDLPVVPVAVDSGPLYHGAWKHPGTIRIRFGEEIPAGLPRAEIEARVHAAINALNPGQAA